METHITDITHVIQLAVAPVFLLTAIGTLITALNNRLGRVIDRRRVLQERQPGGKAHLAPGSAAHVRDDAASEVRAELHRLARRARLIYFSILGAVTAALLVCLVVKSAFVGALLAVELARLVAVLFILAMGALIVCLGLFLREVFLAVADKTLKLPT
ncbi:MAG TPA: DUF2721 domain-containing protein [Casimicrobiaceae bacterium]|nr:DUF2721 domain-containing protein [Casimicrobiaceae bacterium]